MPNPIATKIGSKNRGGRRNGMAPSCDHESPTKLWEYCNRAKNETKRKNASRTTAINMDGRFTHQNCLPFRGHHCHCRCQFTAVNWDTSGRTQLLSGTVGGRVTLKRCRGRFFRANTSTGLVCGGQQRFENHKYSGTEKPRGKTLSSPALGRGHMHAHTVHNAKSSCSTRVIHAGRSISFS